MIDSLLTTSTDKIKDMIAEYDIYIKLSDKKIRHIKMLIDLIKKSTDENFINDRRHEIKMILYNNRKVVLDTHKLSIKELSENIKS